MPLSDADVQKQIKHMMAFIDQEANEKAEEIDAKAEEEFNIEKGRLVQQQRVKIMEIYERKEKQVELQKKIQNSNLLNQARLKILKAREDHLKNLHDEARSRLVQITTNQAKYKELLQGLIAQALFQLVETEVVIICRQQDVNLVKEVSQYALSQYRDVVKKDVKITVESENFLPSDCAGGVIVTTNKGKIKVVNSLEERLELVKGQMLPELREMMFGHNPNRKFFD
ncbi:V-type proton ATPase subunit E-like [Lineus longissimus]|uniref:V-type proton ATPase subunit E-like n=1 Tax=Lineus longissimus TaxID=88925 RepID=UPI002B4F9676